VLALASVAALTVGVGAIKLGTVSDVGRGLVVRQTTTSSITSSASIATSTSQAPSRASSGPLDAEFAELRSQLHGVLGIAISAIGENQSSVVLGEPASGPAWSTIKVPLAIAVLRDSDMQEPNAKMVAAITESDNAAAESLWDGLGDPLTAAEKVGKVLSEAGDHTKVEFQRVRPPFTAFGQTDWPLLDQAKFISFAVCDHRDDPVFKLMGQIEASQAWGLGHIPQAQFKGGWGPQLTGNYVVRQIGVIPVSDGKAAVAIAVQPPSGTFDDGIKELTEIADWLSAHRDELPHGQCGS
jgi:hypothetical protein